jgi:hypothetical protein
VLFATASQTSDQNGMTGCNCGVHGGRKCNRTFAGTATRLAVCHPVLATTSTSTLSPSGSAGAAHAARASAIRSTLTRGRITVKVSPVRGRANPYPDSHSDRVRPHDRGRHPRSHHTRRVMGFRPSLASSSAPTSTAWPGFARRSCWTRCLKFLSTPGGSGGRPPAAAMGGAPAT